MALLIQPNGTLTTLRDVHKVWYDGAREMVGGPAQIVELCDGRALIVNEEFQLRGRPLNIGATSLLQEKLSELRNDIDPLLASEFGPNRTILGPAILLEDTELTKIKVG